MCVKYLYITSVSCNVLLLRPGIMRKGKEEQQYFPNLANYHNHVNESLNECLNLLSLKETESPWPILEICILNIHPGPGVSDDEPTSPDHVCILSLVPRELKQKVNEGELEFKQNSSVIKDYKTLTIYSSPVT